jgi:hypothetical protein
MPQLMRTSPRALCGCSNYLYFRVVLERLLRRLTLFATNAALLIIKKRERVHLSVVVKAVTTEWTFEISF